MDASSMITSKWTIAGLFVASLAWTGIAKAENPCGAPSELLDSCEAIAAPGCHEICQGDAMITSCMADSSAACMDECAGATSSDCEASCMGSCEVGCTQALVSEEPEECTIGKIVCSASCMGSCSAGCEKVNNKIKCYAECSQHCSAQCSHNCGGAGDDSDAGDKDEAETEPDSNPPRAEPVTNPPRDEPDPEPEPEPKPPRLLEPQMISDLGGDIAARECQFSCAQACTGSCGAQVARNCELGCQTEAAASCKSGMTEACQAACDEGGVLACNGQYIDVDDIDACLTELEHKGLEVGGPVEALRDGSHDILTQRAATCSVEDHAKLGLASTLFMIFSFGAGATVLRRRRR
jgi:hypothetical protein